MKRPKDRTLKDERRAVIDSELESLKKALSARYESQADRLLSVRKPVESNSLATVSGGRPESNRRKF
jgi:hypothetical protein